MSSRFLRFFIIAPAVGATGYYSVLLMNEAIDSEKRCGNRDDSDCQVWTGRPDVFLYNFY
ncbi:MAG: hypothetical protein CMN76_12690 [Spirochaetaceae bacterium]|nr:hypothetical protein [Spirochaetaceae bacterium]